MFMHMVLIFRHNNLNWGMHLCSNKNPKFKPINEGITIFIINGGQLLD